MSGPERDEIAAGEDDADALLAAAAALEGLFRSGPDSALRRRVRAAAEAERAPSRAPVPAAAASHAEEHRRFSAAVAQLQPEVWDEPAVPRWNLSVRELVAHQAAAEGAVAQTLGLDPGVPETDIDPEPRTHHVVERFRGAAGAEIVAELDRLTAMVSTHAATLSEAELDEPTAYLLFTTPRDILRYRAFETWTHRDDILLAAGRGETRPIDSSLRQMGALLPTALPAAVGLVAPEASGTIRLILDGPGGGTWDIVLGRPDDPIPDVWLKSDMFEFCKLAAARRTPDAVAYEIEGRSDLAVTLATVLADFAPM